MSLYHVRIELREPGFELRIGRRDEPFLAGYDITADTREQAARLAIEKLSHDAAMSGVGWSRVIERVLVGPEPVPAAVWEPAGEPSREEGRRPAPEPAATVPAETLMAEGPVETPKARTNLKSHPESLEAGTEPTRVSEQAVWRHSIPLP